MDLFSLFSLDGKVALVTGASKGIGFSIAQAFAAAGAKVVVCSRKQDSVDAVAKKFKAKGYEAMGVECNVGNIEELPLLVQKVIDKYGQLDILVNNASTNPIFGPVHETSLEAFDKIMNVNVKACFELCRLSFPHLRKSSNASVINISSIGWTSPEQGLGIYSVSKAALVSLTKVFAKEWAEAKIRVNVITPGIIKTKFSEPLWSNDKIMSHVMDKLAIKRTGKPQEIGALALFLASQASSYTTGSIYTADGGYTI